MENINREILRPIGTIIISFIGLISIFIAFNKIFIGAVFGLLIIDAFMAINVAKQNKPKGKK